MDALDVSNLPLAEQKDSILRIFTWDVEALRLALRPVLYGFLNVDIVGTENVAGKGRGLVVANYSGPIDAVLTAMFFPRTVTFLADRELFTLKQKLQTMYDDLGVYTGLSGMWRMGRPFVDILTFMIGDGLKTQMLQLEAMPLAVSADEELRRERILPLLEEDRLVIVFLEETSPGAESMRRDFVARLAVEAGAPVYPTYISGTEHALQPGRVLTGKLFSEKIRFAIGPALQPDTGFAGEGTMKRQVDLSQNIRREIDLLRQA
jgi:1-acyl-sn-glycerol-3-phosphate acyltransferase